MSRSSPQLHRDILRIIAEYADRRTACVMMRCCRALYQDAVATVLAEPVLLDYYWVGRIRSDNRLVSFIRFMRAEDGRRWRLLRGLMFGDREFNPRMAQALAEGIRQATNITYLEFEQLESLLTKHGDIRDALTTLKNVKHLKLSNAAKHACTFLESVQWPLVTVGLVIAEESGGEWDLPDIYKRLHPASLLRSARETLVQVSCNSWDITQYSKDSPDYPNVKRLEIEGVWFPTMPQWVKTYPNLTTLLVFPSGTDIADMDEDDRAEFDSIRQANLEALEKRCWPKLDGVIAGSVADFYVLGLPCRVHTLDLGVATWCLPLLPDALDRVRPVVIRVSTDGEFFASKFKTYFEQASNALQDLEELKVTIRFYSDVQDIPRVLIEVLSMLQVMPKLRSLTLYLDCLLTDGRMHIGPSPPSPKPLNLAEKSLHEFERSAFYRTLFQAVPPLQAVNLEISGVRDMEPVDERVMRLEAMAQYGCGFSPYS